MAVPRSVTRVSKNGSVKFVSNVNAVEYTLNELIRGALRDVGRFIAKNFRLSFYSHFIYKNGGVARGTGYKVNRRSATLQVGIGKYWKGKFIGISGIPQEIGNADTGQKKLGLLQKTVMRNIPKIIEIESKYLSELSKDVPNLIGLSEEDYEE